MTTKPKVVNLCIVGAGDVVQVRHADILRDLSDKIRVKCIVSSRQEAVDIVQKALGYKVQRFNTLAEAVQLKIDAALVAVPASKTMEVANLLLRLGIPMYVEKPLATETIMGAKFVEDVINKKLPVIIGENFRNQERFRAATALAESCGHAPPDRLVITDFLRRGARQTERTEDEFFVEHIVHSISAARLLSMSEVIEVKSAKKDLFGDMTAFTAQLHLASGAEMTLTLNIVNTWSEDRYMLMYQNANTMIRHDYNFERKKYTDTVAHYHGTEDLVKVVTFPDAACGIRVCWDNFLEILHNPLAKPSDSLLDSVRDIQVRDAMVAARKYGKSIPVVPFNFNR